MIGKLLTSKRDRKRLFSFVMFLIIAFIAQRENAPIQDTTPVSTVTPHLTQPVLRDDIVATNSALVVRVIDGDTIELNTGQKLRYIGIDTPELSFRTVPDCLAQEAHFKNKELVEGKTIIMEKDVSETDRYGRILRYVWIDSLFVNKYLVEEGYALASSYPPDIKYQDQLQRAEEEARAKNKGLWGNSCK